jgi:hypothetical protein
MGISAERKFEHFSLFINAEDTRQTRYELFIQEAFKTPSLKRSAPRLTDLYLMEDLDWFSLTQHSN